MADARSYSRVCCSEGFGLAVTQPRNDALKYNVLDLSLDNDAAKLLEATVVLIPIAIGGNARP